jgi:hypothetical protein
MGVGSDAVVRASTYDKWVARRNFQRRIYALLDSLEDDAPALTGFMENRFGASRPRQDSNRYLFFLLLITPSRNSRSFAYVQLIKSNYTDASLPLLLALQQSQHPPHRSFALLSSAGTYLNRLWCECFCVLNLFPQVQNKLMRTLWRSFSFFMCCGLVAKTKVSKTASLRLLWTRLPRQYCHTY